MAWPRVVTTPWLWPCVVVGPLLVLLAAWLLLRDVRRRRAGLDEPAWHPVNTGAIPAGGRRRRHRRDPGPHPASAARGRAGARAKPRTGPVPQVPAPRAAPRRPARRAGARSRCRRRRRDRAASATSRRDLRPPTGLDPGRPAAAAPSAEHRHSAGPGRRPPRRRRHARPPGRPRRAARPASAEPSAARPVGLRADPSRAPPGRAAPQPAALPTPSGAAGRAPHRPSRAPHPARRRRRPGAAPTRRATACHRPDSRRPAGRDLLAGPPRPSDRSTVPHGRPSWVPGHGATAPPRLRATAPVRHPSPASTAADPPAGRPSRRRPVRGVRPGSAVGTRRVRCTPAGPPGSRPAARRRAADGRPGDRRLPRRRLAPRMGTAADRGDPGRHADGHRRHDEGGAAMTRTSRSRRLLVAARQHARRSACPRAPRRSRSPSPSRCRRSRRRRRRSSSPQDVLTDVGAVLAAADAALDPAQLPPRVEGPALAVRTAEYVRAAATAGAKPPTALPTDEQALIVPQTDVWPRTQLVVTKQPDDLQAPRILVHAADRAARAVPAVGLGTDGRRACRCRPPQRRRRAARCWRPDATGLAGDPGGGAAAVRGRPGQRRRLRVRRDVPAGHVPDEHRGGARGDGRGGPGGRDGDRDLHARSRHPWSRLADGRRRRDRRRPAHHRVDRDAHGRGRHDPDLGPVLRCAHRQAERVQQLRPHVHRRPRHVRAPRRQRGAARPTAVPTTRARTPSAAAPRATR